VIVRLPTVTLASGFNPMRFFASLFSALWCLCVFSLPPAAPAAPRASTSPQGPPPAAEGTGKPSEPAEPAVPRYTSVRPLPMSVTLAQLHNGLTVIVQENHVAPVATVRCYVKNTGSAFEGRHLGAGLSHVLEHVVAGGSTKSRSETEIRKIIETFGGATNAYTTNDMTSFFIDCPAKNALAAIDLLADWMQHAAFVPAEFARELKVVRRELADDEVDRGRVLYEMLDQTVYTTHPARHPVIGYLQVLNRTTNQAIIDFYHERYVPNNQIFVVVGDVKTQEVLERVARQWQGTPRGYETYVALPEEPLQVSPREAVREMEGPAYDLAVAWPTVDLAHPDLYALDLAANILGEGESSRLVRRLKHERPLVLSVAAASSTPHYVRGYFAVTATAPAETWRQAAEAILREVYRLREELVDPVELAKAKKQKAAELVFQRQTVQQAADSLGHCSITTGDPLFDAEYTRQIQKVTAEEIRAAARRWFVAERLNRAIIAPPGGAPKPAAEAAADAGGAVRLLRLPNGLRMLLRRSANLPLVNLQAYVLAGSTVDTPQQAGRSALVAAMLERGTAHYSARQIAEYFDSTGGQFGVHAGRFTVYASATVLREDLAKAAELLAECFTQPTFPAEEFAKVKQLALGGIAQRSADPHAEISEAFCDALPAASPYHVEPGGKAASVEALSLRDLAAYHARYFVPSNMIVTVFGDIDPDEAQALVQRLFGHLPAAGSDVSPLPPGEAPTSGYPGVRVPGVGPGVRAPGPRAAASNALAGSIVRHKTTNKDTGMLMLGYPCESIFDKQDHAAMIVLQTILSGYGYPGGWLHEELRGAGLVYFVQAIELTGPVPGYFAVLSQTQPDKIDEVVSRIRRNLAQAKEGKIPADDFRAAVRQIVAMHAQENTTLAEQAQQAALDELYGLGHDYDKTFDARIGAVTLDEVIRAARKYLDHSVLVTSSPAGRE
jgi:zinc protease